MLRQSSWTKPEFCPWETPPYKTSEGELKTSANLPNNRFLPSWWLPRQLYCLYARGANRAGHAPQLFAGHLSGEMLAWTGREPTLVRGGAKRFFKKEDSLPVMMDPGGPASRGRVGSRSPGHRLSPPRAANTFARGVASQVL